MEVREVDSGVKAESGQEDEVMEPLESQESPDQPLLVAMQPGVDVPDVPAAVEVVVVTAEDAQQLMQGGEIQTVVDSETGQVVTVAAVEEVQVGEGAEEIVGVPEQELKYITENPGVIAQPRVVAGASDSSDDLDSSSSEEEELPRHPSKPKKVPKKREFSYRIQWKNTDMINAMKAVTEKKMTIRGAAKKHNVPYSTLKDRIHGRVQHGTRPGVKTVLSPEEEDDLVRYVKDMEAAGFELRCLDVRDRAGEILQLNHGHNTPYKDHSPGHNWFSGFVKRHQGMEFKKATNRNIVPSLNKQKNMCKRFFDTGSYLYKKYKLHHRPERIFTVREVPMAGILDASVLVCASADGHVLPPFVTFKGQRVKLTSARSVYSDAFFTCSHTGRVTDLVMLWWFRDHFLKKIPGGNHRPVVLMVDRPVSDITFQLVQLAREERVHLISMPNGISHLLQPLDDVFSDWLEGCIARKAKKWSEENPMQQFTQKVLAQLLQRIWKKHMIPEEIRDKFQERGLYPLTPGMITTDRIATAAQLLKETRQISGPTLQLNGDEEDSPFAGLSLLSALSSHEYATMDSARQQGAHYQEDSPPVSASPPPAKRRRRRSHRGGASASAARAFQHESNVEIDYETTVPEDNQSEASHEIIQYGGSVPTDAELQVIHQVMREATEGAKRQEEEAPSLAEQLVAAKNDPHRISQAVESIGGNMVEISPGPESGIIDTPLSGDSVASRLSRRLLGTPITTTTSVKSTFRSPRRLAQELARDVAGQQELAQTVDAQNVVTEQIEQSVVMEEVPVESHEQQVVEGQEIIYQDMSQLQEVEIIQDGMQHQVIEGAQILTEEQAQQLLQLQHDQQVEQEHIIQEQEEVLQEVQEEVVQSGDTQEVSSHDNVITSEQNNSASHSDVQNVVTQDGQQMIMTSSGEIMTLDQFNALTTLADMTSHEITSQNTTSRNQEEVQMEPQIQQEVVTSEPQQVFMTSSGEEIIYNNEEELMTSLAHVGQQQVVEPEQPQYVTSVQEIPIEQQVQNLISQENNVILQQAPRVRQIKIVRPKIQVVPGSREVKLLPSRQPTKIIRIVRQKPKPQPQTPQIISLPSELFSHSGGQPIILQQDANGQFVTIQEPQQEVVQEVVLQ